MSRQTNESLSTAMISLQLPGLSKSRPSSCGTSPFLIPRRYSRPSSSLEPGQAVRMSTYSVNSSESSGGSSNSESGASPQSVQSGRSRDAKPAVVNFDLTALRCDEDAAPSHWYQLPANLPPLKRPRRSYRQCVRARNVFADKGEAVVSVGLKPQFAAKRAPRQSGWVKTAKLKHEQHQVNRLEKALEISSL